MHFIQLHKSVNQAIELLFRLGVWQHSEPNTSTRETIAKLFFSIYPFLFPISLIAGAIKSESFDDSILLIEIALNATVLSIKIVYIVWKKEECVEFLNRICVHFIEDKGIFTSVKNQLNGFMKSAKPVLITASFVAFLSTMGIPILGNERKLFFKIGFPFDYENNEFAFWSATIFIATEGVIMTVALLFTIFVWYLLLNCGLKYDVLGNQLQNLGVVKSITIVATTNKRRISVDEEQKLYQKDLVAGIESYNQITESTHQLESFLSPVASCQLATSAACICSSIYCLAFVDSNNFMELIIYFSCLLYITFDIFVVMYYGNQIKFKSDRLSYILFESNWIDQTQSGKKNVIIFGEQLMEPQQLTILKIYPQTLETFLRILNSAYSMFNILQNFK